MPRLLDLANKQQVTIILLTPKITILQLRNS